ncbi:hypothetical protein B5M09_010421 [Aphanomyces astaci]|uniref:RGS domain-containing protein n=1 Tax=Aphanomyces astaci TaxID=112090 RepID=A0A3R7Y3X7_APHAT|nr:hypothetical protein B5M09_010421 [Aphanomyces astaci]
MSDDDKVVVAAASSVGSDSGDDSITTRDSHHKQHAPVQPQPNLVQTVIFKLPPPIDTAMKKRGKQKRTRSQVQRIMGWYPPTAIQDMMQADQSTIEALARDRAARKVHEALDLQRALLPRRRKPDNADGNVTPQPSPARGGLSTLPSSTPNHTIQQVTALDTARTMQAMTAEVAAIEAKLALLEQRDITSSASTVEYTLDSSAPSDFNFAPFSTQRQQQLSALTSSTSGSPSSFGNLLGHFPRKQVTTQRILSKSLRELYRQVGAVPVNDDSYADQRERDHFLDKYRYQVRATEGALRIQTVWRMHRFRVVFCRWRATKLKKKRRVFHMWAMVHSIDKIVRLRLCRQAFAEWAEEVECNIKLRLIELKLLQHSSTLYKLPTIVKNLFVTNSREWLDGPQSLERRARTASTHTVMFVDHAFADVEDRSGGRRTCNRIYELRVEMEKARTAVARKFVQTTFLQWKAVHQEHSRVVINAEMCLRRAFRMAFMKRPAWVGERVLVAYQMWYRYTVFKRHKRRCLEVPVFTTPLTQWDQWIKAYRDEQIRILEAQAKGPLAWMRRYFHLLVRFWQQRHAKKVATIKAKLHYQRRMVAELFESWHRDTVANLDTRGRLKHVFHAWRFYVLQKQHCRPQKRRVAIKAKQRQAARSWDAWKEVVARHDMIELDRLSKLLQPQVYPKMCQVLFYWADVASQRTKHHVFQRWKATLMQRKNFSKFWCTATSLYDRALVRTTFLALRSTVVPRTSSPPLSGQLVLTPDPDAILDALEKALPYMYRRDHRVEVEPYSLYSFHLAVRDGHVAAMEAMMQHDPLLVYGREPVYGNTALHVAVGRSDKHLGWFHQREVLGSLLSHGASAFAINHVGQSALLATSDLHMRHYIQTNGFVPRDSPSPTFGRDETTSRPAPFLYVMANKLLNRKRVQAVQVRVGLVVSSNLQTTRAMLVRDRSVCPDECRLDWVGGGGIPVSVDLVPELSDELPSSFHATHYFGKDTTGALESHLATDFVQHLMAKPSMQLKPVEDEVKALDAMVRATENQLLQLERRGTKKHKNSAGVVDYESKKVYGSIDEEILQVQHHRAWTELRIAVKLAHPQPPPASSPAEADVIKALHNDLPSETDVLVKLDEMIAHQQTCIATVQTLVDASRVELQTHQDQYTTLLDLYTGDDANHMYSQLVTTRLAVDEHKVALQAAEKKLQKHQAKLEQLDTVLKLYSGPIDEQRTYTQDEYATLSSLLHLQQHTYDRLMHTRSKLESRYKDLDQESLEQPAQANLERSMRKSFRTTAKRLLVQHQVLTQMRRSSSALLDLKQHKWFVRSSGSPADSTPEESPPPLDQGALTKVAFSSDSVVRAGLQHTLDADKAATEVPSALVQAYRRSITLLFDAERQMVANEADAQRRADVQSQASFVEINPVTGQVDPPPSSVMEDGGRRSVVRHPKHQRATVDDVTRLDATRRRGTLIVPSVGGAPPISHDDNGKMPVNKTRETLRRVLLTRGSDDVRVQIYPSRVPQSARGGPISLWKADGMTGSVPAADMTFMHKHMTHDKHVTAEKKRTSPLRGGEGVPPMQRTGSSRSPVRHRHSTVEATPDRDDQRQRRRMSCSTSIETNDAEGPQLLPLLELNAAAALKASPLPSSRTRRNMITSRTEQGIEGPLVDGDAVSHTPPDESPQVSSCIDCEVPSIIPGNADNTPTPLDDPPASPQPPSLSPPSVDETDDAAFDDVDVLLSNFTTFSQTLRRQYLTHDPTSKPVHSSRLVYVAPPNSTAVPLRSMDDILQRDDSFRLRRAKPKHKYPKRTTSTLLPSISGDTLTLAGKSSALLLRSSQSIPRLTKTVPPRYILPPKQLDLPSDLHLPDNQLNSVAEDDDWGRRIAHIELQLFNDPPLPDNPPKTSHPYGQPAKLHVTTLDERPFHKAFEPKGRDNAAEAPDHMGLGGEVLQGSRLNSDQRNEVWLAFAEKPMSDAVQQAYSAVYPNTYPTIGPSGPSKDLSIYGSANHIHTTTSVPGVVAGSSVAQQQHVQPPSTSLPTQHTIVRPGQKSKDICFWQAVEGFKSIQNFATKGAAFQLPPAKLRRQRRGTEIYDEFLHNDSPHALTWLLRDHPDSVHAVEVVLEADGGCTRNIFDDLQRIVEVHMKAKQRRRS